MDKIDAFFQTINFPSFYLANSGSCFDKTVKNNSGVDRVDSMGEGVVLAGVF